jgi:hypothetical protein
MNERSYMKPEFEEIKLNEQVILTIKKDSSSYIRFENEVSGTILTINHLPKKADPIPSSETIEVLVFRDDIGEIFLIPYQDIETVGYIISAA